MTYSVTITKKHCIGSNYESCTNCPLAKAIREQLPKFKLLTVGGTNLSDVRYVDYGFDHSDETGWCFTRVEEILTGKIKKYKVEFKKI